MFPQARFHLQELEMQYATGRHMAHPFFAHAYELEAVLSMVRLVYGARVQFHDGDAEIVNGITVHHVGGHTLGLQVVRVWTRVGWVVLASDEHPRHVKSFSEALVSRLSLQAVGYDDAMALGKRFLEAVQVTK